MTNTLEGTTAGVLKGGTADCFEREKEFAKGAIETTLPPSTRWHCPGPLVTAGNEWFHLPWKCPFEKDQSWGEGGKRRFHDSEPRGDGPAFISMFLELRRGISPLISSSILGSYP